jgi:hypothetical protein
MKNDVLPALLASILLGSMSALAQGTSFTYQGQLTDGDGPASGIYDLRFAIYDAATAGNALSGLAIATNTATPVTGGCSRSLWISAPAFAPRCASPI